MTEENKDRSDDIKTDLFGSKLEIKKIFLTYLQIFKNIKDVIDDFHLKQGNYTRPVKYALSIIAPYVIIIQVFDIDMAKFVVDASMQANDVSAQIANNEQMATFYDRYIEIMSSFTKLQYEFLPVFYAVFYIPIIAFWIKVFYKRTEFNFAYYYAVVSYAIMTMSTITLLLVFLSIINLFPFTSVIQISGFLTIIFYIYCMYRIFGGNILYSILKTSIALLIGFISVVIPMTIILLTLTVTTM